MSRRLPDADDDAEIEDQDDSDEPPEQEEAPAPVHDLPTDRFVHVEYPGFVENVPKAIDTLGGRAGIAKACWTNNGLLKLRHVDTVQAPTTTCPCMCDRVCTGSDQVTTRRTRYTVTAARQRASYCACG
jgi:hypothetical protein